MIELLGSWIIHFISTFGYKTGFDGIFTHGGTAGNLTGSLLSYWLGWWGEETVVRKVITKFGKYVLISESEYDRSERWFRNHGEFVVLLSRVLPVLRTFISLPAGVAKMKLKKFYVIKKYLLS